MNGRSAAEYSSGARWWQGCRLQSDYIEALAASGQPSRRRHGAGGRAGFQQCRHRHPASTARSSPTAMQMSTDSNGRVLASASCRRPPPTIDTKKMAAALLSDRFVLLAPHGVVGAVAGRIGGLHYFESPTFKPISGIDGFSRALPLEEQRRPALCLRWCRWWSSAGAVSSSCAESPPMATRSASGGSPTARSAASRLHRRAVHRQASTARTAAEP
jgi:hypothetical protein